MEKNSLHFHRLLEIANTLHQCWPHIKDTLEKMSKLICQTLFLFKFEKIA
jgi:hypothetical protein